MLIEERTVLEAFNLRFDNKIYTLPFDINELNEYEFVNNVFLGKDEFCILKSSRTLLEPSKAQEIIEKYEVAEEFKTNFSNLIIISIETTRQYCIVLLLHVIIRNLVRILTSNIISLKNTKDRISTTNI